MTRLPRRIERQRQFDHYNSSGNWRPAGAGYLPSMATFRPAHFINRESSWLEFNWRVLEEAMDPGNPLLERLKFFTIFSTNLDEFFEVRVAGLKQQIEGGVTERSPDGLVPRETFHRITRRVRELVAQLYAGWREDLQPALAKNHIRFLNFSQIGAVDVARLEDYYRTQVRPVVTPLAIDPAHPFPQLLNKSLNLIVQIQVGQTPDDGARLAIVQVPRVLPRLIRLPGDDDHQDYLFLAELIGHYFGDLFPGMGIRGYWCFRVTRNSELYIGEEEEVSLLEAVENELHKRRRGDAVRLEVQTHCPPEIQNQLLTHLRLQPEDLYEIDGPLNPVHLMTVYDDIHSPELRARPFLPRLPTALRDAPDIFTAIRRQDILLHHPYDSFNPIIEFLETSADDPGVLAIKLTLYRTGGDPRIMGALAKAAENGKQVTAVVELKARFDEANNIQWARQLEEAGVHVVYGLVGYKIHGKICLVVRREGMNIVRYVHLSTGNYNPITARIYTDLGLLTCNSDFGEDATNFFNLLTGICQFSAMRKFIVAPFDLHDRTLALIEREQTHARQGLPARIVAKMNALVDRSVIEALYRASRAGVQIDLAVRGICCLRPQVKGVSENITVRSVVDRFLEHSRAFYFENACQPEVYLGSADWMPRNFFRRVEIMFPIENGILREQVTQEILGIALADNVKARFLQADGSYRQPRLRKADKPVRSQSEFIRLAEGEILGTTGKISGKRKYPKVTLAKPPTGLGSNAGPHRGQSVSCGTPGKPRGIPGT
ncbi:MAG: polyphosphate kinase 1 [Candidatus Omnitrophica bacterium]|nr:polyphosphate kinase 1 [Candidatus Omnitrophota bacterium]